MERLNTDKIYKKSGGGPKDMPRCERCGKPVRITRDDFEQDEILCPNCASESVCAEPESSVAL